MFRLIKSKDERKVRWDTIGVETQGHRETMNMLHTHIQLPSGIMGPLLQLPHGFLSRELIVI